MNPGILLSDSFFSLLLIFLDGNYMCLNRLMRLKAKASNASWAWQVLMGPGIYPSQSFSFSILLILLDRNCIYRNWLDQKHDTWASNAGWAWQVLMGPEILLSGSFSFSFLLLLLDGNCIYINQKHKSKMLANIFRIASSVSTHSSISSINKKIIIRIWWAMAQQSQLSWA